MHSAFMSISAKLRFTASLLDEKIREDLKARAFSLAFVNLGSLSIAAAFTYFLVKSLSS